MFRPIATVFAAITIFLGLALPSRAQTSHSTAEEVRANFLDINRKILAMAQDFPENKYGFRLKPEMRSFGEVIVHIASGNVYAAQSGRGEKV